MRGYIKDTIALCVGAGLHAMWGWWGVAGYLLVVTALGGLLLLWFVGKATEAERVAWRAFRQRHATPTEGDPR